MSRLLLITLFFTLVVSSAKAEQAKFAKEVIKDDIKLELQLEKSDFIVGEPILITVSLTNCQTEKRWLAEVYCGCTVKVAVYDCSGKDMRSSLVDSSTIIPQDFRWEFAPGQTRSVQLDLYSQVRYPLSAGQYTLTTSYFAPKNVVDVWHGRLTTSKLAFVVTEPNGEEKAAAEMFAEARASDNGLNTIQDAIDSLNALRTQM
ncbi:MAG: hypothetical protein NT018_04420 [Armatimonadetes bacterium]|nr:hypothetical protein [Armatimonadota bacterium]